MFNPLQSNLIKKYKQLIITSIISPYFLGLLITAAIVISLPPIFKKYEVKIVNYKVLPPQQRNYYVDLNGDGISDKIRFTQINNKSFNIIVFENNKILNQWNFVGQMILTPNLASSRIGNDSLKSIYFFDFRNDKIYLNCLNPFENKFIVRGKFVANYIPKKKYIDCHIKNSTFFDSKNNGISDFYFYCDVDFSNQPRTVFKFDPINDKIYSSKKSYANLKDPEDMVVDTTDHKLKIIFATMASGNSKIHDPNSDMYSWLMMYNKNLRLEQDPIKIGFYPSKSRIIPIKVNGDRDYLVMNIYDGVKNHPCTLRLFNSRFKLIREKKFYFSKEWEGSILYHSKSQPNYFYIIHRNGVVIKYDSYLNKIGELTYPPISSLHLFIEDLNGTHEAIFRAKDGNHLILVNSNLRNIIKINCGNLEEIKYATVKLNGKKPPELVLASNRKEVFLLFQFNDLYYLKYPIYLGIYLLVFFFIYLIEKVQKQRAELKYETEKQIAELQLRAIKNQVDPHFTLNTINSIGSLMYKQDHEKADYVFGKYSKLLRLTILNSDKIVTTLSDELHYVENYLDLEQFRCNNKFRWNIEVGEEVNQEVKIPKMLIHTFAENAIKHGLRHLDKNGELNISISKNSKDYHITITDNGIGRKKSKSMGYMSTGKGLRILDQILDLYENLIGKRITYKITDMTDGEYNPIGTKVLVKIPLDKNGNKRK